MSHRSLNFQQQKKKYYTPLGEMVIQRRGYQTSDRIKFKADNELGLPKEKWLPSVLELACVLGVSSEFPMHINCGNNGQRKVGKIE